MEQAPYWADIAFPVLSFGLTIVMPAGVALWVIFRTLKDFKKDAPRKEDDAGKSSR